MLVTLLNNLKVQERQNRVCTTVAIAIVAETCAPFTVLPALMNEYKVGSLPAWAGKAGQGGGQWIALPLLCDSAEQHVLPAPQARSRRANSRGPPLALLPGA